MPKVSELFPSKYLRASDLAGKYMRATISKVEVIDVGGQGKAEDTKPVLSLKNRSKALVMNKTNSYALAKAYGDELDDWVGKEVEVYPDVTQMQGRTVDCIRCRQPLQLEEDVPH